LADCAISLIDMTTGPSAVIWFLADAARLTAAGVILLGVAHGVSSPSGCSCLITRCLLLGRIRGRSRTQSSTRCDHAGRDDARLAGWETAAQLRTSPETHHIKLVLITAQAREDDKAHGNNVRADAYLTKPFDPANIIRVIRQLTGTAPTCD
jgi:DNA-binding NarL/FixJ family response regulator